MARKRGFISYSHEDIGPFKRFRQHLAAIEQAYDIDFWADESILAGNRWAKAIESRINTADHFILLLSPSFIASRFIREHEIPAILARRKAVDGLIFPVVLSACAFERFAEQLQVVPTYDGRIRPIDDWRPRDRGHDRARAQIESAIASHYGIEAKTFDWYDHTTTKEQDRAGPIWIVRDDQLAIDPTGEATDRAAAATSLVRQLHQAIIALAHEFVQDVRRVEALDGWRQLGPAARQLMVTLDRDTADIPSHIGMVHTAVCSLSSFLDLDERLRRTRSNYAVPLPADLERQLRQLVQATGPWLREFPTARKLDAKIAEALVDRDRDSDETHLAWAQMVVDTARRTNLIASADRDSIMAMVAIAQPDGAESVRAAIQAVSGARNLVYHAATVTAAVYSGFDLSEPALDASLCARSGEFLAQGADAILGLIGEQPPDFRKAIQQLIIASQGGAVPKEHRVVPKGSSIAVTPPDDETPEASSMGSRADAGPEADLPADIEAEAKSLILAGRKPPTAWRPYIRKLDFSWNRLTTENLAMIGELTHLQHLNLTGTGIDDVSALASLSALRHLNISNTRVGDISPLANCLDLQYSNLAKTEVAGVNEVAAMASLQELYLSESRVDDLSPLSGAIDLRKLSIRGLSPRSLTLLKDLRTLESIDLSPGQVTAVESLGLNIKIAVNVTPGFGRGVYSFESGGSLRSSWTRGSGRR